MNQMLKPEVADIMTKFIDPMDGPGRILEIGTGWAESAEFFSRLKPDWMTYTIDGFGLYGDGRIYDRLDHDKVLAINRIIESCGNVVQILGDSRRTPWELPIDVLLLDGDHTEAGCAADFYQFGRWVTKRGIVVFDDYTQPNNPNNGVAAVVDAVVDPVTGCGWEIVYRGYYCAIIKRQQ